MNVCKVDKQRVHVILCNNVRNMKKAVDDVEVPSVGYVSYTLKLAVLKSLLSKCMSQTNLLMQGTW